MPILTDVEISALKWFRDHMPGGSAYEQSAIWTDVWLALRAHGIADDARCRQIVERLDDLGLIKVHWGAGDTQPMIFGRITGAGVQLLREREADEAQKREAGSTPLLIFLSSDHQDQALAAQLKAALEPFRVNVFVAHQDIDVSSVWRDEILDKLRKCDCAVALVTERFRSSQWCNQECGFVIARGKPIFSVMLDGRAPRGLMEMYQGIPWDDSNRGKSIRDAVCAVLRGLEIPTESLVAGFSSSDSMEDASCALQEILLRNDLTRDQANQVAQAYLDHPAWRSAPFPLNGSEEFFRRHLGLVDPVLWEQIRRLPTRGPRSVPM